MFAKEIVKIKHDSNSYIFVRNRSIAKKINFKDVVKFCCRISNADTVKSLVKVIKSIQAKIVSFNLTDRIKLLKLSPCSHLSLPSHDNFLTSPFVASFNCLKALANNCTASYMSAGSTRSCEGSSRPHSFLCFSKVCCTIGSSGSIRRKPVKFAPEY